MLPLNKKNRKNYIFSFLLIFSFFNSYSQIRFEPGYYIDNGGNEKKGFIKNVEWKNNPTKIEFKVSENAPSQTIEIESMQEFQVYNSYKYIKAFTKVDMSSQALNSISHSKDPEWSEEKNIFLKVLTEGRASLYSYEDKSVVVYYFKVRDKQIEPLVYKQYYDPLNFIIANNTYKQQLLVGFIDCEKINVKSFDNTRYKKNDLEKAFRVYNSCHGDNTAAEPVSKRQYFHLSIRPGATFSLLKVTNPVGRIEMNFPLQTNGRLGVEAELTFPFNKGKWSTIIEPVFQKASYSYEQGTKNATFESSNLEIPVGIRHRIFFNNNSSIFLNASAVYNLHLTSSFVYRNSPLEISNFTNAAFGIGARHKKISIEGRYYTNEFLLKKYALWDSTTRKASLILGYKIF